MILNKYQQVALLLWMGNNDIGINDPSVVVGFERFANEETKEWRIIGKFGIAGKLWNNDDRIYVSGYSNGEIGDAKYKEQQIKIDNMNVELGKLINMWAD